MKKHSCKDVMKIQAEGSEKELGMLERFMFKLHLKMCRCIYCKDYTLSLKSLNETIKRSIEKSMFKSKENIKETEKSIINEIMNSKKNEG